MPGVGLLEVAVLLFVFMLVFGAKRMPAMARSLGTSLREFKDGVRAADPRPELDEYRRDET